MKWIGSYKFFFYSRENNEPPHIHVQRDERQAKFWLDPMALAGNWGFASHELSKVRRMVHDNRDYFLRVWNEYFGT